ncbi:MAG: hypothetical protein ABJH04_07905 [Cyclobacteriaceae bacterium]
MLKISQIRNTVYLSPENKKSIGHEALNPIVEFDKGGNGDEWGVVSLKMFAEEKIQISCSVKAKISKGAQAKTFTTTITIPIVDLQKVLSQLGCNDQNVNQNLEI